jgi:hypothetical protein
MYKTASALPYNTLHLHSRTRKDDAYGDARYVLGFDDSSRLEIMKTNFYKAVIEKAKYTTEDIWFGHELNKSLNNINHKEEVLNLKALAEIVGLKNLEAPLRQNECTDIILFVDDTTRINVSLKSDTKNGSKGYQVKLHKAPNFRFCDIMMVFYRDNCGARTHVSVVPAKRAYAELFAETDTKHPAFRWSPTLNTDILAERLYLNDPNIKSQLLSKILDAQD